MHALAPRILLVVQHYKGEAVHPLLSLRNCTLHTSPIDAVYIQVGGSKNPPVGTVVVLGNFGKPVLVLHYSLIPVFVVLMNPLPPVSKNIGYDNNSYKNTNSNWCKNGD